MSLNENIKAKRTALKLSQEYVADQLGISRQAVSKWETGQSEPSASNLAELAALFEITVSELVDPQNIAKEPDTQENCSKEKQRNARMHVGRVGGYILLNGGWDGYSSGLYSDSPYYWLTIAGAGLVLLLITSIDMSKKHKLEKLQAAIGAVLIFSIFFLPKLLPFEQTALNYFLADLVSIICLVLLNLKYWRYLWKSSTSGTLR